MKKQFWIALIVFVIMIGGVFTFLKFNPPLTVGDLVSSEDDQSAVVAIAIENNGFRDLNIVEVTINNNEKPQEAKLQVATSPEELVIIEDFEGKESLENKIFEVKDATIKVASSSSSKLQEGPTASASNDKGEFYSINVIHNEPIRQVHINYQYFGVNFSKTVEF